MSDSRADGHVAAVGVTSRNVTDQPVPPELAAQDQEPSPPGQQVEAPAKVPRHGIMRVPLLGTFIALVAGFVRTYKEAEPGERAGLRFWGLVGVIFAVWEIGAASAGIWANKPINWPTLSTTIGHLETAYSLVGIAVVGVIVFVGFYAVTYRRPGASLSSADPDKRTARSYTPKVFYLAFAVAVGVPLLLRKLGAIDLSKYQEGYIIYGVLGVLGVLVPAWLYRRHPDRIHFPTFFATVNLLRERFKRTAVVVLAGLAILLIHLALYPWPNMLREPNDYSRLTLEQARSAAEGEIRFLAAKPALFYTAAQRARDADGHEVWLVRFEREGFPSLAESSGCVIEVGGFYGFTTTAASRACSP